MDINQRVVKIIDQVASSKAAFSKATGISPVILSHIGSGRNKVSVTTIIQILEAYPKVNAAYILIGKGPMFVEDEPQMLVELNEKLVATQQLATQQHKLLTNQLQSLVNHIKA